MSRWTVEAGRQICFDGQPFAHIAKEGNTQPTQADGATHLIVELFNREGATPDTIQDRHLGRSKRRAVREVAERGYSMTYGELPPFKKFEHDVHTRIDPEGDGTKVYWPEGTLYPMELVGAHEIELAESFGLEEFEAERSRTGRNTSVRGFKDNERAIYEFVEYLSDRWKNGDEEAGDLASSIMTTLGYEWI